MKVTTVSMVEKEAKEVYESYREVVKTRKEKYLKELKKVYHALKLGKKVIDIYDAFKDTGIGEDGNPKLAIAQAHKKEIFFRKEVRGGGIFNDGGWKELVVDVRLPAETFAEWKNEKGKVATGGFDIANKEISTKVPIIPAHLMPKGKLEGYYLLWEVDEWKPIAKAQDPFLLKRVNANVFIVLAAWDLTPVEQMVMRGR